MFTHYPEQIMAASLAVHHWVVQQRVPAGSAVIPLQWDHHRIAKGKPTHLVCITADGLPSGAV